MQKFKKVISHFDKKSMKRDNLKEKNYEIEFLRALSVLFVVFFHFDLFKIKGGFVGVDIFFVISGYLITSIIFQTQKFDLLNFYLKRLRRLLPIILLTVFICLIVGMFVLSPIHFNRLINSSLFSIFGLSNFFFFSEAGYFDHEKLFKPLLHTWSLAIEMQFYLIWPILILILKKFIKSNFIFIFILIFISSILLSSLYSPRSNSFFFFTGFRFYEFALGSILFFLMSNEKPKNSLFCFIVGLIIILFSVFYFDSRFHFPGWNAVLPCFGATLIIYSRFSRTSKLGKIITLDFIKYLGSKSYTIYMMHWPFLIFYSYQKMGPILYLEKIILIGLILILSNYIYKYYEQPFRYYLYKKKINFNKILLSLFLFIFVILISLKSLNIKINNPFIENSFYKNEIINTTIEGNKKRNLEENQILLRQKNEKKYFEGKKNKKKILLLGNSHAFDFYMALNTINLIKQNYNIDYIDFEYLHCFKIKNFNDKIIDYFNFKILNRKNSCEIVFKNESFEILNKVDNLILGSRWPLDTDFTKLIKFFKKFNTNIIIVSNGQKFYDVPTLYFKRGNEINDYAQNFNYEISYINKKIKLAAKENRVNFYDKSLLNCDPKCIVLSNDILLYSDKDHWSYDGANYFGNKIVTTRFFGLLE